MGFRPFVYTTAAALGLAGSVRNDSSGAVIEVEGDDADRRRRSWHCWRDEPPPLAVIESVETQDIPVVGGTGFDDPDTSRTGGGRTLASPDVAMCADCAAELRDPADRRYRHPFVTCTNCGPRFTIITALPYDRAATTMARLPDVRRLRARVRRPGRPPLPRPAGLLPRLRARRLAFATGRRPRVGRRGRPAPSAGGCCATGRPRGQGHRRLPPGLRRHRRAGAVAELRKRKQRGDKPFAVMVRRPRRGRRGWSPIDDDRAGAAHRPAAADRAARRARRAPRSAAAVAPGNPDLGVMLAYTPLHHLLFGLPGDAPGPRMLVMTQRQPRRRADRHRRRGGARRGWRASPTPG